MRRLALALLAACGSPDDPTVHGSEHLELTGVTPPAEAATTAEGCSVWSQSVEDAFVALAPGAAPGGALASARFGLHLRGADGVWSPLPGSERAPSPTVMAQGPDGQVWAAFDDRLQRLDPLAGTWVDTGFPGVASRLTDLDLLDDGTVRTVEYDGTDGGTIDVHTFDGTTWSRTTSLAADDLYLPRLLSDGRVVGLGLFAVVVSDGQEHLEVPLTQGPADGLYLGADDTWVVGGGHPQVGTLDGMIELPPLGDGAHLVAAWAAAVDDVWLVVTDSSDNRSAIHRVLHYDGVDAVDLRIPSEVGAEALTAITGDGEGGVLVIGGSRGRRVVLSGDAERLTVELDLQGIGDLRDLAVDDVLGSVHAFGPGGAATWRGGRWDVVEGSPATLYGAQGTASGGRLLHHDQGQLTILDGDRITLALAEPGTGFHDFAGSEGVLFAAGGRGSRPHVQAERGDGQGWQALDLSALPNGVTVTSIWADGPDDVWLGLVDSREGTGSLAHHDGTRATLVRTDLDRGFDWMARLQDGALWATSDLGATYPTLWRDDGTTLEAIDLPFEARSVWIGPSGERVVAAQDLPGTSVTPWTTHLVIENPETGWAPVVDEAPAPVPLVGVDGVLFAATLAGAQTTIRACP